MAVEYVGSGNDDGVVMGRSTTDKIGFYNATPAVRYSTTALATATLTVVTTDSSWGFASITGFSAMANQLAAIVHALNTLGLVGKT